jgi:hypothetical protein
MLARCAQARQQARASAEGPSRRLRLLLTRRQVLWPTAPIPSPLVALLAEQAPQVRLATLLWAVYFRL